MCCPFNQTAPHFGHSSLFREKSETSFLLSIRSLEVLRVRPHQLLEVQECWESEEIL
jgi:hypothetical protein